MDGGLALGEAQCAATDYTSLGISCVLRPPVSMCGGRHADMGFASPAYGVWQLSRHSQLFFHVLASLYVLPLSVRSLGISCV